MTLALGVASTSDGNVSVQMVEQRSDCELAAPLALDEMAGW